MVQAISSGLLVIFTSIAVAYLSLKLYDIPIRKWLTKIYIKNSEKFSEFLLFNSPPWWSNCPSHLETAEVASAFPSTLVILLPISQKWSIGKINAIPSGGMPNIETSSYNNHQTGLGTPAIPLLVSIRTKSIVIC